MYVYKSVFMYVCMYACMYVCMYVCTYVCMYVCYIYIYILSTYRRAFDCEKVIASVFALDSPRLGDSYLLLVERASHICVPFPRYLESS